VESKAGNLLDAHRCAQSVLTAASTVTARL